MTLFAPSHVANNTPGRGGGIKRVTAVKLERKYHSHGPTDNTAASTSSQDLPRRLENIAGYHLRFLRGRRR